jgi:hypothetical protein
VTCDALLDSLALPGKRDSRSQRIFFVTILTGRHTVTCHAEASERAQPDQLSNCHNLEFFTKPGGRPLLAAARRAS